MKSIEINTSFNVIIKFPLASFFERGLAYAIDMLIVWASIGLLTLFFSLIATNPSEYLFLYFAVPIFGFYTLISEMLYNGQTIGKKALSIRVVRTDGQRTTANNLFMRWIFRLVDLYFSAFLLAVLSISASKRAQRIGDLLSDTVVIKTVDNKSLSLHTLKKLNSMENTELQYPEVTRLSESEMMVVKECIDRYAKYPNEGHTQALDKLVKQLEDVLQISCKGDKQSFLNTLIHDYVVLTR